jgi:tetratricopeptide (TPR) repeat protein
MTQISNFNAGLSANLLQMGDFVKIIARAQDYALYSSLMPGLDEKIRDKYYKQALEWLDFFIERNPLFSHDAYMGKIYTLYLRGDLDRAKFVYKEMKETMKSGDFDRLGMLFS